MKPVIKAIHVRVEDRKWRTLIRVTEVDQENDRVSVVIPAWNYHERVDLSLTRVSEATGLMMVPELRFHAYVNIGAETARDLRFEYRGED